MPKEKNLTTLMLTIFSGILLILSGTSGYIGVYGTVLSTLALFFENALVLSILRFIALILIFLASLGGFSVILGGYLIHKSRVSLGKFIIGLGAGVGIPGLLLTLFAVIVTQEFSAIIAQHGIMGWTGIALSLIARKAEK